MIINASAMAPYNFSSFSTVYRFCTIIINVVKINYRGCGSVDCSFDRGAKREIRPVWRLCHCASERESDFTFVSFTLNA